MVIFKNKEYETINKKLEVDEKLPDFELLNQNLEINKLNDFKQKIKVFSIIPSIDTGVCDAQTKKFNEQYTDNSNVAVITVSMDLPFAFKNYCAIANLENSICLSDHRTAKFGKDYGLLIKDLRLLQRAVIIADQNNQVKYVEYVKETSNSVNFEEMEKVLYELLNN